MKEKLTRGILVEIAWVLLTALLSGGFSFVYTYLNDTDASSEVSVQYEQHEYPRTYSSDVSLKEIARRKQ